MLLIKEDRTPVSSACKSVSVCQTYIIHGYIVYTYIYMSLLWGLMSPDTFWSDLTLTQVAVVRGQGRTANVSQQENGLNFPLRSDLPSRIT